MFSDSVLRLDCMSVSPSFGSGHQFRPRDNGTPQDGGGVKQFVSNPIDFLF
jgi:hypothetical protein